MDAHSACNEKYGTSSRHDRRLVICLSNRLLAESLATALAHRGWTIEAVGTTPSDAVTAVTLYGPDICLLGVRLLAHGALEAAGVIATTTHTHAVIMGATLDPATFARAKASGVAAVIAEDRPIDAIDEVLARVARGEAVMDLAPVIPLRPVDRTEPAGHGLQLLDLLTSREHEVLARMANGESTTEMARAMEVSTATVRSHIQRILGKLGVHTRLMAVAIHGGAVDDDHAVTARTTAVRAV